MQAITFLPCQDLAATEKFYVEVLGLKLATDQLTCQIYRVAKNAYWGFCEHIAPISDPDSVILTLVTDNVDEMFAHLASHGVPIDGNPRMNNRFGIYHFFSIDPNGYRVEIQSFSDENWDHS